jgi:hypothetical protein
LPLPTLNDVSPVNALLSNLSVAYKQDRPAISDLIFPRVRVELPNGTYFTWSKASRWRSQTFKHAPGDVYKRGVLENSTDTYRTDEYAMEYKLPDQIRTAGARNGIGWDMIITSTLQEQLALQKDLSFATDFMTSSSGWTAGASLVAGKWSVSATTKPVADVIGAARTLKRAIGSSRNYKLVGVGGTIVESALIASVDVASRIQYVRESTVDNIRGALAAVLGLDELIIADREYNTAKEGQTASYAPVIDDDFLLVAVPTSPGLETPAAGYTFEWDDGNGVAYVEEYRDDTVKSDIYRAIEYYDQKQVDPALGIFFADVTD